MESKYFTLFIYSGDPIDMKNFKKIGQSHIGFTPRKQSPKKNRNKSKFSKQGLRNNVNKVHSAACTVRYWPL